ncbi:hypothetical protein [Streptomyces sp. NPDC001068]
MSAARPGRRTTSSPHARVEPAAAAPEDRTVRRLSRLADLLVGRAA